MSIQQKLMQTVLQFTPAKEADPLIEHKELVGKPIDRVDGILKVTGGATFSAEYDFEELAFASLVYSSIAKGKIQSLDASKAKACAGVLEVISFQNAPKLNPPAKFGGDAGDNSAASMDDVPILQDNMVHWNGQPIAMVVANTQDQADEAAHLVEVTYEPSAAALCFDELVPKAPVAKDVLGQEPVVKVGDAVGELKKARVKVDHVYRTARYNHNAIEPHATTAVWTESGLQVFDGAQNIYGFRNTLANIFKVPPDSVSLSAPFVGGGFGGKGCMWQHVALCVLAAKVVKRPVRLALSREGVFRIVGGRTLSEQRVALAADANSKFTALVHEGATASSEAAQFAEQFSFPARVLYASKSFYIEQKLVTLDTVSNTFMRAPGESIGTYALESAIDELAYELNIDPIELRRLNQPEKDPIRKIPFSSRHTMEAFDRGAEKFGWQRRPMRSQRDGKWLIGQGVSTAYYPYYRFGGKCGLRLEADGTIIVKIAAHEMGMGTATVQMQHAADRLAVPITQIRFEYGSTNVPESAQAGGSNQTATISASIIAASKKFQEKLLRYAHRDAKHTLTGYFVNDVEAFAGGLRVKADPEKFARYADILAGSGEQFLEVEAEGEPPLEWMKYSMHSYGAQFCELRINEVTGEVRINRWVGSFDAGTILNAKTAASQFRGGIIMGIGMALTEETLFDERNGRIINPSLAEYHVPVHMDIPQIDVLYTDIPDPQSPLGAHGIGEIGITGAAAAISNAVHNAIGKRIREIPITLDKVLAALE